jgi:NACHT domain
MDERDQQCLADLRITDPRVDKSRIEHTKGGLLNKSFCWVLANPEFRQWRNDTQSRLLWVKGDPGKGKTMLLIGIIDELSQQVKGSRQTTNVENLSYFLCQGTDARLNNATAILRGIIYLLIDQQPFLILHLRKKYDHAGRKLFEDANTFYSLSEILRQMIQDPGLTARYLVIDALDECEEGLPQILELITETATQSPQIKWIISSRNKDFIEQKLRLANSHTRLSLELNAEHVSHAVNVYIDHKISQLDLLQYDKALQIQVRDQMRQKSDGTFLWVALAFEELQKDVLIDDILEVLEGIPTGLVPLYGRMMKQIQQLQDRNLQRCLAALSVAALAYRPLHLLEISVIADLTRDLVGLETIIKWCGSFLTIRDNYVYFIHQSAKDYLTTNASAMIFPAGRERIHYDMFLRSLDALSKTLRRDMYNLQDPGSIMEDVHVPNPDPLASIRYSIVFMFDHLCETDRQSIDYSSQLTDKGAIYSFFIKHFLHWLESLSLIHEVPHGLLMIRSLLHRVQVC